VWDRHPDIVAAPLARSGAAWHRNVRMSYQPPPQQPSSGAPGAPAQYSPDGRWYWDGQQWLAVAAPGPVWAHPYAPLESRATSAVTFVAIATAAQAVLFVGWGVTLAAAGAAPGSAMQIAGALVLLVGVIVLLVGFMGSAVAVPMWMHRAYRNLPALGAQALRWSPRWAAGGWFIPFANFVIPFLVMRELWHHSGGMPEPPGPRPWWAAFIASGALAYASTVATRSGLAGGSAIASAISLVSTVGYAIAGILLILLLRRITRRQQARYAQLQAG
jgi:hypothetical protein